MHELLPLIMPEDLQVAALKSFDTYYRSNFLVDYPKGIQAAVQWFRDTVTMSNVEHPKNWTSIDAEYHNHDGPNSNADIHLDNRSEYRTKYILTLCTAPNSSTILFPDLDIKHFSNRLHSQDLFSRDSDGALRAREDTPVPVGEYLQGINGQIARFSINSCVHAAAPLPKGAKKLLFVIKVKI